MLDYAKIYSEMHEAHPKHFAGLTVRRHATAIAELVRRTSAKRLLDYGCGKGYQYLAHRVHETWGGLLPHCYDIGVRQLAARPVGYFDGVICTDVLEHIAPEDVEAVIADVVSFVRDTAEGNEAFVLFGVDCGPSVQKSLAGGRDIHLTQQPPAWWESRIRAHARDGLIIYTGYTGYAPSDR